MKARDIVDNQFDTEPGLVASRPFELTLAKNMSKREARAAVEKNQDIDVDYEIGRWNLTYKGVEFFSKVYMETIDDAARAVLLKGDQWGQESYLGYVPSKDMFISGWDLNSGSECFAEVYLDKEPDSDDFETRAFPVEDIYGMVYDQGNLQELYSKYPDIVDIRFD